MIEHLRETVPGVVGNGTMAGAGFVAWVTTEATPVLHALSLLVTILAGVATALYYTAKWLKVRKEL